MKISGMLSCTLVDYPGEIAAIVFTQGCNYKCPYCHNYELIPQTEGKIGVEDIITKLKNNDLISGVVVSGGEPTLQNDLPEFCERLQKMSFLVKVDTNGSNPAMLKTLLDNNLVNYVAMDIKATDAKYNVLSGTKVSIDTIVQSIELLRDSDVSCMFRTTVVKPMLNLEDIKDIKDWLSSIYKDKKFYYKTQKFIPVTKE